MAAAIVHVKIPQLECTAAALLDSRSSLMGRHVKVRLYLCTKILLEVVITM